MRPSSSRYVEGFESAEEEFQQEFEMTMDEGDDSTAVSSSTAPRAASASGQQSTCEAAKKKAERDCGTDVLCLERASELRCQAPAR